MSVTVTLVSKLSLVGFLNHIYNVSSKSNLIKTEKMDQTILTNYIHIQMYIDT